MPEGADLPLQPIAGRPGLIAEQQLAYLPASLVTSRRTASGVWSTSPRKRTSPWRPSSARATEIFILEVSRPTKTALSCCMARPRCVRLGTGLSGATLVRRIARDEPPPLQKRTYGLPDILNQVQFGRSGWQQHQREIVWARRGSWCGAIRPGPSA